MRKTLFLFFILLLPFTAASTAKAQEKKVENRPYCDLRPFHFGVIVGTHWQDTEFRNTGLQTVTLDNQTQQDAYITCDQDQWDNGFQVGVLGELRLAQHFALRIAPTLYFGNRHYTFRNLSVADIDGLPTVKHQDMKTAYIGFDFDIIFAAKRFNNHRPYIMAGLVPMINLTTRANDYLRMNTYTTFFEVGLGCDLYMPFFKLRPELKFMYGIGNSLNTNHKNNLRDPAMLPYTQSVDKASSKVIALTFYFE